MRGLDLMRKLPPPSTLACLLVCVVAPVQVLAADNPVARIQPRVSVTHTWTDNVRLSADNAQADQVTEISPGVVLTLEGARLRAYVDYALSEIAYAQGSSPRRSQHLLNGFGTLEAVEDWAYLDVNASISQQAISAFGSPSISNTALNSNQTEVSSYRISPYVRGKLGSWADYDARYSLGESRSDAAGASDVVTQDGTVHIRGDRSWGSLGWFADAGRQRFEYSQGRDIEADRLNLGLSYAVTPQLNVFANVGRESDNFTTQDKQSDNAHGFGANWSLSERTRVSLTRGQRPLGSTHAFNLEHRTARTVWRFTDTQDVSATPNQFNQAGFGAIYDLLFNQFAALEPRPQERARLVNAFLQDNGIQPDLAAINSFLTSALVLQRRQDAMFMLLGVRDTLTFVATRSDSRRLDLLSVAVDDLSTSNRVRQHGHSVNWTHRLTPDYALGVLVSQQRTTGSSGLQSTRLQQLNASLSGRVGRHALAALGLRHVVSRGSFPYDETAIHFNLTVQF